MTERRERVRTDDASIRAVAGRSGYPDVGRPAQAIPPGWTGVLATSALIAPSSSWKWARSMAKIALRANRRIVRRDVTPSLAQSQWRRYRGRELISCAIGSSTRKSGGVESAREAHARYAARQIPKGQVARYARLKASSRCAASTSACAGSCRGPAGQHGVVNGAAGADANGVLEDPRNADSVRQRTRDGDRSSVGVSHPAISDSRLTFAEPEGPMIAVRAPFSQALRWRKEPRGGGEHCPSTLVRRT